MRKIILLAFIFTSFGAFSAGGDYIPAFRKPASKTSAVLQKGIQKDLRRFVSILFKKPSVAPIKVVENTSSDSDKKIKELLEEE